MAGVVEDEHDAAALADAAKKRGTAEFLKKTPEGIKAALAAYTEAVELTPENHLLYANRAACYAEQATKDWAPRDKVLNWARSLAEATKCTELGPDWAKGYLRVATAQVELVAAAAAWEKRKVEDAKWKAESAERRAKDPPPSAGIPTAADDMDEDVEEVQSAAADADKPADAKAAAAPASSFDEKPDTYLDAPDEEEAIPAELEALIAGNSLANAEASCRAGLGLDAASQPLRETLQDLRDAGHGTDEESDRALVDAEAAEKLKAEGTVKFSAKQFRDAAKIYTSAMVHNPFNHLLYSNRSACYAEDDENDKALADANRCVALKPDFPKGYSRQGLALYRLGRYPEAEAAARAGLAIEGDAPSKPLADLLGLCEVETKESPEFQAQIHTLRANKRRDAKMQDMLKGFNMGGMGGAGGVQMFNGMGGGGGMGGLGSLFGAGGAMGGMGGMGSPGS